MVASTFIWSSLLSASLAAASPLALRRRVVQESRSNVPSGFTSLGAAPPTQNLALRFALASNDLPGLEQSLLDVSDPSSANYGKFLTKDQANAFLAPTPKALKAVTNWLSSNNVTATPSASGDWLVANIPVAKANALLGADYHTYEHVASGKTYARTLSVSLPSEVAPFIDLVFPSTTFNNPAKTGPIAAVPQSFGGGGAAKANPSCDNTITPQCIQTLYGVPPTPATQATNQLAVSGFVNEFAQKADLQTFLTTFRPDIDPATTFDEQGLDGGINTQTANAAGVEANLDIQYTIGIATNVPTTFISVGQNTQDGNLGGFLDLLNAVAGEDAVPQVLSTSYGENESDLPDALAFKLCAAAMALGARGTSVIFSSGDGGVSGTQAQQCDVFQPSFPSGCPYLTSVGSVAGQTAVTGSSFSSGGFSNVFSQPDFQATAVSGYLSALGNTNQGLFNTSGRGFPDVAAHGENALIVSGGKTQGVDGTSVSAPIFAGVISLLNDELIANGKSSLGFLNPFLYANAAAFDDVTLGSNPGCNTDGFPALAGWDPVTGLGTPNFAKLRTAAGLN